MDKDKETAILRIQQGLKCSKEEAEEVYNYDCQVDKTPDGSLEHDLHGEALKNARKATRTGTRQTGYKFSKRERKPDFSKQALIQAIGDCLQNFEGIEGFSIENPERLLSFGYKGEKFTITLTKKRK